MFKLDGHHIGDPWFFVEDGTAHMWFLTQPVSYPPEERGHHWDIGYATSTDLKTWEYHGIVLERGAPGEWDSQKLATGSVMKKDGRYWMAYTGHPAGWLGLQRAGLAVSDDLRTWKKLNENPISEAALPVYWPGHRTQEKPDSTWRDPFLVADGEKTYHLICALRHDVPYDAAGVVGVAASSDMEHWKNMEPLATDPMAIKFECPQTYEIDGRWYLIYSSYPFMVSKAFKAKHSYHVFRPDVYNMVSDRPWGPYRLHGMGLVQPAEQGERMYAGQLVQWEGRWYMLGFKHDVQDEKMECISDPVQVTATAEGIKSVGNQAAP